MISVDNDNDDDSNIDKNNQLINLIYSTLYTNYMYLNHIHHTYVAMSTDPSVEIIICPYPLPAQVTPCPTHRQAGRVIEVRGHEGVQIPVHHVLHLRRAQTRASVLDYTECI